MPLLMLALSLLAAPAAADEAPTRRLDEVDLSAPPPQLDYKSWRDQVYADGYLLIAPRSERMAYLRRSLAEVPEAAEIMDKRAYRRSLGTALMVSGAAVYLTAEIAQSRGLVQSTRGNTLGLLGMGSGLTLFLIAPRMSRATAMYNDWARAEGIPSWP